MNVLQSLELPRRRRRMVVSAAIAAAGLAVGSAAWACVPSDPQTRIKSCTKAPGSGIACKTPLEQPAFPNATFVKGPAGSTIVAYVNSGLLRGVPYDLKFASKALLATGTNTCADGTKIAGPVVNSSGGTGLSDTTGTIPANASLGAGQVCFADAVDGSVRSSTPAIFKVVV